MVRPGGRHLLDVVSPRELLDLELRRRGRVWGEGNQEAIANMRAEIALLHRRPMLRAVVMAKHYVGRAPVAIGDGCYLSCRVSSTRIHQRGKR